MRGRSDRSYRPYSMPCMFVQKESGSSETGVKSRNDVGSEIVDFGL